MEFNLGFKGLNSPGCSRIRYEGCWM